ncbi:MAG TPA: hypothetical protein VLX31_00060 [Streptosporangiaceae bacterium]|nr:hypothetical protein [Streptosporangiaceae bacterium]
MSQHGNPEPDHPEHPARYTQTAAAAGQGADHPSGHPAGHPGDRSARKLGMDLTDLADDHPESRFDRILKWVPRILSSKPHIVVLVALGVYLIVLPLVGIAVSAKSELIGGNYTNVTSDIGACIAAGGTLHLVNQSRKRQKMDAERQRMLTEVHALLHHVHAEAAAQLGQPAPPLGPAD